MKGNLQEDHNVVSKAGHDVDPNIYMAIAAIGGILAYMLVKK